jgi:hypothetical protein
VLRTEASKSSAAAGTHDALLRIVISDKVRFARHPRVIVKREWSDDLRVDAFVTAAELDGCVDYRCGRQLVMKSDTRPAAGGSIFAGLRLHNPAQGYLL